MSEENKVVRATHGSAKTPVILNGTDITCYVLENGKRVLSGRGMQNALELGQSHGGIFKGLIANKLLKPFINKELAMELNNPISFIRPGRGGGRLLWGMKRYFYLSFAM